MTTKSRYGIGDPKSSKAPAKKAARRKPAPRPGVPGGVRDTNRRERIQGLTSAAMQLFLARGIEATAIDDITSTAGMAKGGFYRYFADKTALVEALLEDGRAEIEAAMQACQLQLDDCRDHAGMMAAWRTLGETLAATVFRHMGVVRLYLQEARGPAVGARTPVVALSEMIGRYAIELTRRAHELKLLRPMHPAVSALAVVGAVERLLTALLAGEDVGDPLQIPAALTTLIVDGLIPTAGKSR